MDSCDVLVVGGGPAGSTLAWKLKERGFDVVILDKNAFPREKVCAGWITPPTLDLLGMDPEAYSRGRVLQAITGFRTGMVGGAVVLTRYDGTVSYGIRRSEFDQYLIERSGARLRLGEPLRTMARKNGSWIVNGDLKTPLVVGAGGHFCPVSRLLRGDRRPNGPVVIAQETEFELDGARRNECPVRGDTPELYFCEDLKGYGWCIRKGDFLNIGLGREDGGHFPERMKEFLDYLDSRGRIPRTIPRNFKGHAYLLYAGARDDLVDDGMLLVGDAAGLACPKSGEGIRPAVESALMAAQAVVSAAGVYRREMLIPYALRLAGRYGKSRSSPPGFLRPLRRFTGRFLMENRLFTRRVLLDRWFLNRRRPSLAEPPIPPPSGSSTFRGRSIPG